MTFAYKAYRVEKVWERYSEGAPAQRAQHLPKMHDIAHCVSLYTGMSLQEIYSHRRQLAHVRARHIAIYLCVKLTMNSYPAIGLFFRRDHTSVLHAFRRISYALKYPEKGAYTNLERDIEAIKLMIEDLTGVYEELAVMEDAT